MELTRASKSTVSSFALLLKLIASTVVSVMPAKVVRPVSEIQMYCASVRPVSKGRLFNSGSPTQLRVWTCSSEVKATAASLGRFQRYRSPPIEVSWFALSDVSEVALVAVRLPVIVLIPLRSISPEAAESITMSPLKVLQELIASASELVVIVVGPEHCASGLISAYVA